MRNLGFIIKLKRTFNYLKIITFLVISLTFTYFLCYKIYSFSLSPLFKIDVENIHFKSLNDVPDKNKLYISKNIQKWKEKISKEYPYLYIWNIFTLKKELDEFLLLEKYKLEIIYPNVIIIHCKYRKPIAKIKLTYQKKSRYFLMDRFCYPYIMIKDDENNYPEVKQPTIITYRKASYALIKEISIPIWILTYLKTYYPSLYQKIKFISFNKEKYVLHIFFHNDIKINISSNTKNNLLKTLLKVKDNLKKYDGRIIMGEE